MELLRLYSNLAGRLDQLRSVGSTAVAKPRLAVRARVRQRFKRLTDLEVKELIALYREGSTVALLSGRFGVHRSTVSARLRRCGLQPRPAGLTSDDLLAAVGLYADGWSVARLGDRFGVDGTTVWRKLRSAGVVMRPPQRTDSAREVTNH